MIDVQAEIARVDRMLALVKNPEVETRKAWIEALKRLDHCDDIRTAIDYLCRSLVEKHYPNKSICKMLQPYLDKVYAEKKQCIISNIATSLQGDPPP